MYTITSSNITNSIVNPFESQLLLQGKGLLDYAENKKTHYERNLRSKDEKVKPGTANHANRRSIHPDDLNYWKHVSKNCMKKC